MLLWEFALGVSIIVTTEGPTFLTVLTTTDSSVFISTLPIGANSFPDLGEISIQCIEEIPDLIDSVKNFFEKYRSEFEDSFILLKIDSSNMVVHSMRMDEGNDISDGPGINCLD